MELLPIKNKIYEIRGQQVMLDFDLAEMYHVETRIFNQSIKRNIERFPIDFMFQLTQEEWRNIKIHLAKDQEFASNSSQIVMSSVPKNRSAKYLPYAFTQEGVAMLSGILRSPLAIQVNISIMRAFVAARKFLLEIKNSKSIEERVKALERANEEILQDIDDLSEDTHKALDDLFDAFAKLSNKINVERANPAREPIGFKINK